MDAAGLFLGTDNTTLQVTFGSNLCTGPQNRVFQNCFRPDATILSDDCAAAQSRAWIDNRGLVDRQSPIRRFYVVWLPLIAEKRAVHLEIVSARTDVEPLSVIHHQATDLAALADPISDNRNERDFSMRREPPENFAIPNRDIGKIVIPGHAVSA